PCFIQSQAICGPAATNIALLRANHPDTDRVHSTVPSSHNDIVRSCCDAMSLTESGRDWPVPLAFVAGSCFVARPSVSSVPDPLLFLMPLLL
ncbi:unnamed protein product, partial [Ectocarpus sp. 12 AP-2014]